MSMGVDELLQRAHWDFFWLNDDVGVVDRPDILYCFCERDIPTLNMVVRLDADQSRMSELVSEVSAAHTRVRSRFLVYPDLLGSRMEALQNALYVAGYRLLHRHFSYAMALSAPSHTDSPARRPQQVHRFTVRRIDTLAAIRDAEAVFASINGHPSHRSAADHQRELDNCTGEDPRVVRFVAYDNNSREPVSTAGMTLHADLGLVYLWGGATVPHYRERGAYSALVTVRIAHARERGFEWAGVHARSTTSAPILDKRGFRRYGRMDYWERPVQS